MTRLLGLLFLLSTVSCGDDVEPIDENRRDSAQLIPLELAGSLQNTAWSPDGDAIVFTRFGRGYNREPADLYIAEAETGIATELVSEGIRSH